MFLSYFTVFCGCFLVFHLCFTVFYGAFESPMLPSAWYSRNVPRNFINRACSCAERSVQDLQELLAELGSRKLTWLSEGNAVCTLLLVNIGKSHLAHTFHSGAKLSRLHSSGSNDDCVDCVRHGNKLLQERGEKDS